MKRRILSLILTVCMLSSLITVFPTFVSADSEGIYTYTIENGEATITDCVYVDDNLKEQLQKKNPLVYYGILQKDSNWDGYGFKLENIKKIEPIEINGKLSLWDYDYK